MQVGAPRGVQRLGSATNRRPLPAGKFLDDYAQFAQTRQGLCQRGRRWVRPQIPGLSPGGLGPHLTSSGFPCGLSSGFPVARRVLSPSSAFLWFPVVRRSPVRSLRPLPGSGSPRFPSGFPFPWAMFTLALPRGGSAGVGPGRPGPRSPALPRPPRLDRAIRPHSRWAAAGHGGMPPQNRLVTSVRRAQDIAAPEPPIGGSAWGYQRTFAMSAPRRPEVGCMASGYSTRMCRWIWSGRWPQGMCPAGSKLR